MKKSFTQEQIVATLHSVENGTSVADALRKIGVTEQPHTALNYQTPEEYLKKWQTNKEQTKVNQHNKVSR